MTSGGAFPRHEGKGSRLEYAIGTMLLEFMNSSNGVFWDQG